MTAVLLAGLGTSGGKMLRRIAFMGAIAAMCICGLCTSALAQESAPKKIIALKAARLITSFDDTVVKNGVVIIEGDRIKGVGAGLQIPANAEVIDLGDATLLPGLIDAHTHLLSELDGTISMRGGDDWLSVVATQSTAQRALLGA